MCLSAIEFNSWVHASGILTLQVNGSKSVTGTTRPQRMLGTRTICETIIDINSSNISSINLALHKKKKIELLLSTHLSHFYWFIIVGQKYLQLWGSQHSQSSSYPSGVYVQHFHDTINNHWNSVYPSWHCWSRQLWPKRQLNRKLLRISYWMPSSFFRFGAFGNTV